MKQTKKKSQKSENKQSIEAQLSKYDLTKLLNLLKDFMHEEISARTKRIFLNQSEMCRKILNLEIGQACLKSELRVLKTLPEIKRISYCYHHDDKLKSLVYLETTGTFLALKYKCEICGREYDKPYWLFSRKEKKALRKLGVKI